MKVSQEEIHAVGPDELRHFPYFDPADDIVEHHAITMPEEPFKSPPVWRQRPRLNRTRVVEVAGSAPTRLQGRLEFHLALDQGVITSFVRGQVRLRKVEKPARPPGVITEQ